MKLRKTNLHVSFFWEGTPFRALSKGVEATYDDKCKKLIFFFNFPSYKTNLDLNQDAEEILNYLNSLDTLEFDDLYVLNNMNKMRIESELDELNIEVVLRLPKDKIYIFQDVQFESDDSRVTFKLNLK